MDVNGLWLTIVMVTEMMLDSGHCMVNEIDNMPEEETCTHRYVNFALHKCHTLLGKISSAILHSKDGNFTETCSNFADYMICVEPNIRGCGMSSLMARYHGYISTYTGAPYNCTRPDTSHLEASFRVPDQKLRYALPSHGALVFVNTSYDDAMASAEGREATVSSANFLTSAGYSPLFYLILAWTIMTMEASIVAT